MNLTQRNTMEHWQTISQIAECYRDWRVAAREERRTRQRLQEVTLAAGCRKLNPCRNAVIGLMVLLCISVNAADPGARLKEISRKSAIKQKAVPSLMSSRAASTFAVVVPPPPPPAKTNLVFMWDQPDGTTNAVGLRNYMTLPVSWLEYDLVCSTNHGHSWFVEATTNAPPVKVRIKYPEAWFNVGWHYK